LNIKFLRWYTGSMLRHSNLFVLFGLVTVALLSVSHYLVFMVVPNEVVMGAVQRVFYFHVGAALSCYAAFGAVFVASIAYLATGSRKADRISAACGEVGFVLCTIVLATGMIWGHSAWNTWFRWEEPRLVTFLVLWLIFLSFTVLRNFSDPAKTAVHSSVLGLLGAASVPLVYISIKFLPASARLHPEVIEHGGLKDPSYWWAFGLSTIALLCLTAYLSWLRYRIETAQDAVRSRDTEEETL
jgi:heme exporter protein C